MGLHSVTYHPAEVTFPPLPQPKLVLDQATPEGCKAELTLDLRTSKWTTCVYVTNSYWYVIVLISHNWIFRLVPYFWGDGEIAPYLAKKLTVPSYGELSHTKRLNL